MKKRRRRKPIEEHVTYGIRVVDWEYHYGFGVGGGLYNPHPHSQTDSLEFSGDLILPEGNKYTFGNLMLYADTRYDTMENDVETWSSNPSVSSRPMGIAFAPRPSFRGIALPGLLLSPPRGASSS